jgi:BASS family bile acid:Na+ symporter
LDGSRAKHATCRSDGHPVYCVWRREAALATIIDVGIVVIPLLLLTALGLDLTVADFRRVRQWPRLMAAGLLGPVLLLPPLAVALVLAFRPSPEIEAGLLLVAASPIGGLSNTYSFLARASTALSVTLTAVSCAAAVVTIPLVTFAFELLLGATPRYGVPAGALLVQLVFVLALPVGLGMFVRQRWPHVADRHGRALQVIGFTALAALIGLVIADDLDRLKRDLGTALPIAAVFVVVAFGAGVLAASAVGGDIRDRFTLGAEFATRNMAVAAAIAVTLAGHVEFALFGAIFLVTEIPLALLAVAIFRHVTRSARAGRWRR